MQGGTRDYKQIKEALYHKKNAVEIICNRRKEDHGIGQQNQRKTKGHKGPSQYFV